MDPVSAGSSRAEQGSAPVDLLSADLMLRMASTRSLVARLESDHAAVVAASSASNADDEHDPEGATIAFERAQLDATIRAGREQLALLEAALARVHSGSYGICEACGNGIPRGRLAARPSAVTCVACA